MRLRAARLFNRQRRESIEPGEQLPVVSCQLSERNEPIRWFLTTDNRQLTTAQEAELGSELHDPRRGRLRRDAAEGALRQVRRRNAPVEVVQQVERFQPELEGLTSGKSDGLRQGDVDVPPSRADNTV